MFERTQAFVVEKTMQMSKELQKSVRAQRDPQPQGAPT